MTIPYIYWLAAGLIIAAGEMVVPGFILMWFGVAALTVGIITAFAPEIGWAVQLTLFALITAAFLAGWWVYQRGRPPKSTESEFNRRADWMIGKTITLTDAIQHGSGRSFFGDTLWQLRGQDAPKGATVRVVSVSDDSVLHVEFLAGPAPEAHMVGPEYTPDSLRTSTGSDKQVKDSTA
ncbi:MAG: NfeD family protein [Pseudomonadota bacterium]